MRIHLLFIVAVCMTATLQAQFSPPQIIAPLAAVDTVSFQPADLDGDGDDDMAIGRRTGRDLAWLRNDGQGNFTNGRTLETGSRFGETIAADADADGDLDVIAYVVGTSDLHVFLNIDGTGMFPTSPLVLPVGGVVDAIAIQRINTDAIHDIVVVQKASSRIAAFLGTGGGTFSTSAQVLASGIG